jgi:probable F420-dependent oxidoreductase
VEPATRPIRFGAGAPALATRDDLVRAARQAEQLGYSTLGISDHVMSAVAPLLALQAMADATTTLRLALRVVNQDFRHPVILAKELATLDLLSGGRVEAGLGAGWMDADYRQSGIPLDPPSVRIDRLEEYVQVVAGLFGDNPFSFSGNHFTVTELVGRPRPVQTPPPILIGGGGRKLLSLAARHADIVGIALRNAGGTLAIDPAELTDDGVATKVGWVRDAAGHRFDQLELNLSLLGVEITSDRRAGARAILERVDKVVTMSGGRGLSLGDDEVLASPCFLVGSVDEICEQLLSLRDRYGFSYFSTSFGTSLESLAPVIEQIARTH